MIPCAIGIFTRNRGLIFSRWMVLLTQKLHTNKQIYPHHYCIYYLEKNTRPFSPYIVLSYSRWWIRSWSPSIPCYKTYLHLFCRKHYRISQTLTIYVSTHIDRNKLSQGNILNYEYILDPVFRLYKLLYEYS